MLHYTFHKNDITDVESEVVRKTVVFLHGFLESSTMWKYLPLQQLDVNFICIDLPGHGKSDAFEGEPSIKGMAESVLQLLTSLNIQVDVIVGHSMGGYVALELMQMLAKKPKIILLNSNFWADSEAKKLDRNRVIEVVNSAKSFFIKEVIPGLFGDPMLHKHAVDELIQEALEMSSKSIADASAAMRDRNDYSNADFVSELCIIQGEFDRLIPLDVMENLQKTHNFQLNVISKAGHMAHIENTEECMQALKGFLS